MRQHKLLLRTLSGEILPTPPIWLMRQAGRYLPEYRELRARAGDFLTLCYTPDLAAEVTLQPLRRFRLDAAILFADILLLPHALGSKVSFANGQGPRLSPVRGMRDVVQLRHKDSALERLAPVFETIRILSRETPADIALIGFAGAPWTVATYMIAGKGTPGQEPALELMGEQPAMFQELMNKLTEATTAYLSSQVEAGAEVLMLFDSWAGSLRGEHFCRHALQPVREIVAALARMHPDIPVISFPRGAGTNYTEYARLVRADCIALDHFVDAFWADANLPEELCLQGNLNPGFLTGERAPLIPEVRRIVKAFRGRPHVFNLGHGITPDAEIGLIEELVHAVRYREHLD